MPVLNARSSLLAAVLWLALGAAPAVGAAPGNDNYLASLPMAQPDGTVLREFRDAIDTSQATIQADLFDPNGDGIPFGGADGEETRCGATVYDKTVWYDFVPEVFGGVQIVAAGYDSVLRVYEYDLRTSLITRTVVCQNEGAGAVEDLILDEVDAGKAYTLQVGGVGFGPTAAGGPLDFRFFFFADSDRDGVLDEAPDRCPGQAGIFAAGGCPPELRPNVRIAFDVAASGVELTRFDVQEVPRGARVRARCRDCDLDQAVRVRRGGRVELTDFVGQVLGEGARLEIFVTRPRARSGRFRHGAVGSYVRYDIEADSLGRRTVRCLAPGSRVPRKRCT